MDSEFIETGLKPLLCGDGDGPSKVGPSRFEKKQGKDTGLKTRHYDGAQHMLRNTKTIHGRRGHDISCPYGRCRGGRSDVSRYFSLSLERFLINFLVSRTRPKICVHSESISPTI